MKSYIAGGLLLAAFLAFPAAAQMPDGYLDVFITRVKPGKRVEFDSINKKMVGLNRKKGDTWLAYELIYGDTSTVYFVSTRASYHAAEEGTQAFEGAITRVLGKAGMQSMGNAFDATVDSEHSELRRRRWDLSANAPADAAAYTQYVGTARYIRLVEVHTRPGKLLDYEAQLKLNKAAQERANPGVPMLVSQSVAGQDVGIFYIGNLLKSLGDLDNIKPLPEVLGSEYKRYESGVAETVSSVRIMIGRFLPELSNPPEEIVAVDSKYWRPAPAPAPTKPADANK